MSRLRSMHAIKTDVDHSKLNALFVPLAVTVEATLTNGRKDRVTSERKVQMFFFACQIRLPFHACTMHASWPIRYRTLPSVCCCVHLIFPPGQEHLVPQRTFCYCCTSLWCPPKLTPIPLARDNSKEIAHLVTPSLCDRVHI